MLKPDEDDYFCFKAKTLGFYNTNLEILLEDIGVKKLILTGIAGNICVLFTAHEAHMRGYNLWVPQDCIASNTARENSFAIKLLSQSLKVKISGSNGNITL